jgi:4-hydroxybenzoate polyprenyltransferase
MDARAEDEIRATRAAPANELGPLYVDLDGTLIATDTLWESVCLMARKHPRTILALPGWLLSGKAVLKTRIAELVVPDAKHLPYRAEVLALLRREKAAGRALVLATASHERVAHAVAAEVGLFDAVLASSEHVNLRGAAKLAAVRDHSGAAAFGYVGDSRADLPVWAAAARALVVGPSRTLARAIAGLGVAAQVVEVAPARAARTLFRALRPHQWAKNVLLFLPIALAHELNDAARLVEAFVAFVAFSAVSSAGYLFNDMIDIEADRNHPTKRARPFAAGTLSIPTGALALLVLLASGFALALYALSPAFAGMLAAYLAATVAYSLALKEQLFLDVLVLAGLYTHRVLAGGVATQIAVSPWLLAFSVFFFLSLALLKRYVELLQRISSAGSQEESIIGRAYRRVDVGLVETMGVSSGYLSILVLGLYVSREEVAGQYATPTLLWLVVPLMLYWISRIWLLARRGRLTADPVLFATTDPPSYVILAAIAAIALVAIFWRVPG